MAKYVSDIDTTEDGRPTVEWENDHGYRWWETFDSEAEMDEVIAFINLENEAAAIEEAKEKARIQAEIDSRMITDRSTSNFTIFEIIEKS